MSTSSFIPQIWAVSLLENLNRAQVFADPGIVNRDYEGEITRAGDTVRINAIGRVTVRDYTKGTDISVPEQLQGADAVLLIDRQKYFNFAVDDVDRAQALPSFRDAAMQEAAYALSDVADSYIASLTIGADTANAVGTSGAPKTDLGTAGKAYEYMVDLATNLDEANVPSQGRWIVVPPWFHGALLKDQRFVGYGTNPQDARLRNGMIGEAAGFTVYKSNNVYAVSTTYYIPAGYRGAITFAEQIVSTEAYRIEKQFGDGMKGLHVYGAKLVRPSAIALLYANAA